MDSWIRKWALWMWCFFGWHTWLTVERLRGNEEGMKVQQCIGCGRKQKVRDRDE
jgi:hypothetical protein